MSIYRSEKIVMLDKFFSQNLISTRTREFNNKYKDYVLRKSGDFSLDEANEIMRLVYDEFEVYFDDWSRKYADNLNIIEFLIAYEIYMSIRTGEHKFGADSVLYAYNETYAAYEFTIEYDIALGYRVHGDFIGGRNWYISPDDGVYYESGISTPYLENTLQGLEESYFQTFDAGMYAGVNDFDAVVTAIRFLESKGMIIENLELFRYLSMHGDYVVYNTQKRKLFEDISFESICGSSTIQEVVNPWANGVKDKEMLSRMEVIYG